MRAHNATSLVFGFFPSQIQPPTHTLTVLAKGSFRLSTEGGLLALPQAEAAALSGDQPLGEAEPMSPRYATDFAPWKPKVDVMLVGSCHQPSGKPGPVARPVLSVGQLRKELVVFGERRWVASTPGQLVPSDPKPFSSIPLSYENAFGGPGFDANPVGRGFTTEAAPNVASLPSLPNLERAGKLLRSPRDQQEPAGFGPLDRFWAAHRAKLGTYDQSWQETRWPYFPEDFDWSFWNSAPADQQLEELRGDERVVLEGLVEGRPRVELDLPALRPRCFAQRNEASAPIEELTMRLDTLHIDGDAGLVTLVWRGLLPVANRRFTDVAALLLAVEDLNAPPGALADYAADPRWSAPNVAASEPGLEAAPTPDLTKEAELAAEQARQSEQADLEQALTLLRDHDADPALIAKASKATTRSELMAILDARTPDFDSAPLLEKARVDQRAAAQTLLEKGLPLDDDQAEPTVPEAEAGGRISRAELLDRLAHNRSLEGVDLSGEDLTGLDFSERNLTGAKLARTTLTGARFIGATLTAADLAFAEGQAQGQHAAADFSGANLSTATLVEARLSGASFNGADLSGVNATRIKLAGSSMVGAKLTGAIFDQAQLESANLEGASAALVSLRGALANSVDLRGADLTSAKLDGAELAAAVLDGAEAAGASLRAARLLGASLLKASLRGADLTDAGFERAQLVEANLAFTRCDGARFDHANLSAALFECAHGAQVSLRHAILTDLRATGVVFSEAHVEQAVANGSIWIAAQLGGARFDQAELGRACFDEAKLDGAGFDRALMKQASLARASLRGAQLTRVNLFRGVLEGADLSEADVRGSNLFECELLEAITQDARFERTNLKRTKLEASQTP